MELCVSPLFALLLLLSRAKSNLQQPLCVSPSGSPPGWRRKEDFQRRRVVHRQLAVHSRRALDNDGSETHPQTPSFGSVARQHNKDVQTLI